MKSFFKSHVMTIIRCKEDENQEKSAQSRGKALPVLTENQVPIKRLFLITSFGFIRNPEILNVKT